jgi:hypothetical protein
MAKFLAKQLKRPKKIVHDRKKLEDVKWQNLAKSGGQFTFALQFTIV